MTDTERERAIEAAGEQMLSWMAEYERTQCLSARGVADFWRLKQQALIRSRSEHQVRAMEHERGLA